MGDVNWCTARHFTTIPGIDQGVANAIVRYRRTHGSFKYFDELWRVSGMNRSKFQILRRHFKVPGERPPPVGAKLPYARLALTESMMDYVCQGQSLASPRALTSQRSTPNAKWKARLRQDEPMETDADRTLASSQQISSTPVKRFHSAEVDERLLSLAEKKLRAKRRQADAEHSKQNKSAGSQPRNPSFMLRTSPSGNNINFTCTIDKRILKQPADPAAPGTATYQDNMPQLNDTIDNYAAVSTTRSAAARRIMEDLDDNNLKLCDLVNQSAFVIQPTRAKQNASPGADKHDSSSHSDYETAEAAYQWKSPLYQMNSSGELPSIHQHSHSHSQKDSDGVSVSSCSHQLTRENLLIHEKNNTLSSKDRRSYISDWIDEVNVARNVRKLLYGRAKIYNKQYRMAAKQSIREAVKEAPPCPTPSRSKYPVTTTTPPAKQSSSGVRFLPETSQTNKSPTSSIRKKTSTRGEVKAAASGHSGWSVSSPDKGRSKSSSPSPASRKKSTPAALGKHTSPKTTKNASTGTYSYKYSDAINSSPSINVLRQKSTAAGSLDKSKPQHRRSTGQVVPESPARSNAPAHNKKLPTEGAQGKERGLIKSSKKDKKSKSCSMCNEQESQPKTNKTADKEVQPNAGDTTKDKVQQKILAAARDDLAKLKKSSLDQKKSSPTVAEMKAKAKPKVNSFRKKATSGPNAKQFSKMVDIAGTSDQRKVPVSPKRSQQHQQHHKSKKYLQKVGAAGGEEGVCNVM